MAYNKNVWQNGDVITAEKLNNLENGIDNIDLGYKINTNTTILFEGNVTTEINDGVPFYEFESNLNINADKIYVTFNDVEYIVEAIVDDQFTFFGEVDSTSNRGPIFTTYPFLIVKINNGPHLLATMNEGTYYLKIEIKNTNMETTEDFDAAVNQVVNNGPVKIQILTDESTRSYYINETYNDIKSAVDAGKMVYFLRDTVSIEGIIGIVMDYIKLLVVQEGVYTVVLTHFDAGSTPLTFIADSADAPMVQEVEDGGNQ